MHKLTGSQSILSIGFAILISAALAVTLLRGASFSTSMLDVLPAPLQNKAIEHAVNTRSTRYADQIILAVSAADAETAYQAAEDLRTTIEKTSPLIANKANASNINQTLVERRHSLLSNQQRKQLSQHLDLSNEQAAIYLKEVATQLLYGAPIENPFIPLSSDPFGFFTNFLMQQADNTNISDNSDGLLLVEEISNSTVLFIMHSEQSLDKMAEHKNLAANIEHAISSVSEQYKNISIDRMGLLFHSARTAAQMQWDLTIITSISSLGITLLFLLGFRSFIPLLVTLASIFIGALCGFIATQTFFNSTHILALVFGSTLIGVGADYAIHCFSKIAFSEKTFTSAQVFKLLLPSLRLSLLTSIIGYLSLSLGNLIVLKQMAVFCSVGLIGTWLSLALTIQKLKTLPNALPRKPVQTAAKMPLGVWRLFQRSFTNRFNRTEFGGSLYVLFCLYGLLGICSLLVYVMWQTDNRIQTLHRVDSSLLEQQQFIEKKLNSPDGGRFFVLTARDEESLLRLEEQTANHLEHSIKQGAVHGYFSTAQRIPSQYRQQQNIALIKVAVLKNQHLLHQHLTELGYRSNEIKNYFQQLGQSSSQTLEMGELGVAKSEFPLWLGQAPGDTSATMSENAFFSTISLYGINDAPSLRNLANQIEGVAYIEQTETLRSALNNELSGALRYLGSAYICIALLICLAYRSLGAVHMLLVPLLATLGAIAVVLATGHEITLFHLFAAFLVLGLGMDYSIFSRDNRSPDGNLAIMLSALTTCLAFGLLSFTRSPMLSAFGTIVLLGTILNWFICGAIPVITERRYSKMH